MAKQFSAGDKVRLTNAYLDSLSADSRKAFSGALTVVTVGEKAVRLSNGNWCGHCTIICSTRYVQKA